MADGKHVPSCVPGEGPCDAAPKVGRHMDGADHPPEGATTGTNPHPPAARSRSVPGGDNPSGYKASSTPMTPVGGWF